MVFSSAWMLSHPPLHHYCSMKWWCWRYLESHLEGRFNTFLAFTALEVQDRQSFGVFFWILSVWQVTYGRKIHFSFANEAQAPLNVHVLLHMCLTFARAWLAEPIHVPYALHTILRLPLELQIFPEAVFTLVRQADCHYPTSLIHSQGIMARGKNKIISCAPLAW